jgi:hypothetical protein
MTAVKYFLDVKQKWEPTQLGISISKMPAVLRFVVQHVFATFVIFLVLFNVTTSLLVPAMLDLPSSSIDAHQPLRKKEGTIVLV